nr:hypothetical transcript [Hymenolepis microstoma]
MAALVKGKDYEWKDSNVALFGTSQDRQVKKESALTEPAWEPVGKATSPFLMVWRVNQFKIEPVPEDEIGNFYNGDSYIICKATQAPGGNKLLYNVHFWIGKHSTSDEYGTAAYKTVELDTYLDDAAIQHREVDGYESDLFKSYFDKFVTLKGGYASGFRHVKPDEYKPRLLHFCKDGKVTYMRQVKYSKQSVHSGDVFILDLGDRAYQFNGATSSPFERSAHEFWTSLPDVPVPEKEPPKEVVKSLYRVSDATGKMELTVISEGSAPRKEIKPDDVYMILAKQGLFVYVGKDCSVNEKRNALSNAHKFMQTCPNPYLPITVVTDEQANSFLKDIWDE